MAEARNREIDLKDLFFKVLYSWRQILLAGLIIALAAGAIKYTKTGTQKTLIAMSRFIKNEIDAELFARAYHQIITEGYAANSMPTDYYSETLKLAGLTVKESETR